jgi:hypothetical protein
MQEIIEKYLMQVVKHVFVEIFARCQLRVFVVLLHKLKFLSFQPSFNIYLRWIPWHEHSILSFHFPHISSTDPVHSIMCNSTRQRNHLLIFISLTSSWADPDSDLNRFQTKP